MGIQEKIREIEEEIRRTQYNKATEHHIGLLKAKIAKLKAQAISAKKSGGGGGGFDVKKGGDARVALIGYPSTGKSTLLSKVTNAKSKSAAYAFTTLDVVPGLIEYKGAKIQLLDLPGILRGASKGTGRGKEVLAVARSADLIVLFVDVFNPEFDGLVEELNDVGIRLDKKKPDIMIKKRDTGGLSISRTVPTPHLDDKMIADILGVYGIHSADVVIRENVTQDDLIDVVVGNRVYTKSLRVVNKTDLVNEKYLEQLREKCGDFIPMSAEAGKGIEEFKEKLFQRLELIRVYTKSRFEGVDYDEPLVIKSGSTVEDVCISIHRDLRKNFKYAIVTGPSAKFRSQRVGLSHVVMDGDVVQIFAR
ncbi:MAG: GTP-binding protein [Candidatus Micrarchaeota archaeon]|nr:GTP-binding protein [Candidatus Micrarchaeota archaeon]